MIGSVLNCSAQINNAQQQFQQQQQSENQMRNILLEVGGGLIILTSVVMLIAYSKAHRQAIAEDAKFQGCIGKTKSEIYAIYGPPDSIVDDAQGLGGTILEYTTTATQTDSNNGVYTTTNRRMFYLNKDNIVTAVKKDSR